MTDNVVETQALNVDTLPVDIITQKLHFLEVADWFNFSLTSKGCLRLRKEARTYPRSSTSNRNTHSRKVDDLFGPVARLVYDASGGYRPTAEVKMGSVRSLRKQEREDDGNLIVKRRR
jgi:hypothetical protein